MKTILIITGRYLPGYRDGGPVRTIKNLVDNLGDEYNFRILTCDRDHGDTVAYPDIRVNDWNEVGRAQVFYTPPGHFTKPLIQRLAAEADLVYLCGCFNDYARNTLLLKRFHKIHCPVVIASMGLFSPKEFHNKYWKKKPYMICMNLLGLFRNITWSASSELEWEHIGRQLPTCGNYFIARDLPRVIGHNLPSKPDKSRQLKVVFVGRIARVKNLFGCIEALRLTKRAMHFTVYGPIADEEYWKQCREALGKLPGNVTWDYAGVAASEEVVDILSRYHVFFLPSLGENYGHAIQEALSAGCPCIISNQTVWTDLKENQAGYTFQVTDYAGMGAQLDAYADMDEKQFKACAEAAYHYACRVSGSDENKAPYREMFQSLTGEGRLKVLFTVNIPSPYRVAFFNELGKYCDLTVLFEKNRDESRDLNWKPETMKNFRPVFLKGWSYAEADAFCPSVRKYLTKRSYDMIVIGIYHSLTGMMAINYLHRHRTPFLLNSDGGMAKDGKGFREALKRSLISAASGWLSTGQICDRYLLHYGANAKNLYRYSFTSLHEREVLEQPLTLEEKKQYKTKLGIKESHMLLSVGQFIYRKGFDKLIEICGNISEDSAAGDMGCYIIGGEPTAEYLELLRKYPNCNVHFLPFMDTELLKDYYYAADLFVLPTREDIWGLVINEAMAAGLPVVTTDRCVAGVEMVDEHAGLVVPFEELETAVRELLAEKAGIIDRTHLLQVARQHTFENMAREHMAVFREVTEDYES